MPLRAWRTSPMRAQLRRRQHGRRPRRGGSPASRTSSTGKAMRSWAVRYQGQALVLRRLQPLPDRQVSSPACPEGSPRTWRSSRISRPRRPTRPRRRTRWSVSTTGTGRTSRCAACRRRSVLRRRWRIQPELELQRPVPARLDQPSVHRAECRPSYLPGVPNVDFTTHPPHRTPAPACRPARAGTHSTRSHRNRRSSAPAPISSRTRWAATT